MIVGISLYTISGSAYFQKFIIFNKVILLTILLLALSTTFIIFYLNYAGLQIVERIGPFLLTVLAVIVGILTPLVSDYNEYSKKKILHIKMDIKEKQFKPGDKIPIKLVLNNKGSKIVTDISIILMAPGLLLESDKFMKIRALGIGDTKEIPYTIDIPLDSPAGDYIIKFKTEFNIKTESYIKKNVLTISVTK